MGAPEGKSAAVRNMVSFWVFGMCNNFAYSVMLGAAQDILKRSSESTLSGSNSTDQCDKEITFRDCAPASVGVVLLCNILPCLVVKLLCPFFMHHIPYAVRHFIICVSQTASLLLTAYAESVPQALIGVLLASFSCGFGETTYLGLASHYSKYYCLLVRAPTVPAIKLLRPSTWVDFNSNAYERDLTRSDTNSNSTEKMEEDTSKLEAQNRPILEQLLVVKSLLKYMIPFGTVYFMQYFVKQGLIELVVFDCSHGFNTTPASQYRWYQVFYHIGVFISRSSINIVKLNFFCIALTAFIQTASTILVFFTAIYAFIPHFAIVCGLIFFIGVVGGANYTNTFYHIHRNVDPTIREFALSTVTFADTIGILAAAVAAIPTHNWICDMKWYG